MTSNLYNPPPPWESSWKPNIASRPEAAQPMESVLAELTPAVKTLVFPRLPHLSLDVDMICPTGRFGSNKTDFSLPDQNFVRMPQARRAHHPRNASNATNTPDATSDKQSHAENVNANAAAMSSANAISPRMRRPLLSILRERSCFIVCLYSQVCAARPESNRDARGLSPG